MYLSFPFLLLPVKLELLSSAHNTRHDCMHASLPLADKSSHMSEPSICIHLQDPYRSQLEALLSAHVLPAFGSPYGHLRAKAAWLAKEFADISFSEGGSGAGPLFNTLLQQVINCLHDRWGRGLCIDVVVHGSAAT
jgi:hypothetical protein